MSVAIYVCTLTPALVQQICTELRIVPKTRKIYKNYQYVDVPMGEAFDHYHFEKTERGEVVYIPRFTAMKLGLGPFSSNDRVREYHKSSQPNWKQIPQEFCLFAASLIERQEVPMAKIAAYMDDTMKFWNEGIPSPQSAITNSDNAEDSGPAVLVASRNSPTPKKSPFAPTPTPKKSPFVPTPTPKKSPFVPTPTPKDSNNGMKKGTLSPFVEKVKRDVTQAAAHIISSRFFDEDGAGSGLAVFGMYPGFGKTACSAYKITHLGLFTLIVVPMEGLMEQWFETMKNFTKLRTLLWTNDVRKRKKQPNWDDYDVIVTMYTCVYANGEYKLPRNVIERVGTLVIDEAHMFCTKLNSEMLRRVTPRYVIACTATLERTDGMETAIYKMTGKHGVFLLNPVAFDLYPVETGIKPYTGDREGMDWDAVMKSLIASRERNIMVVNLMEKLVDEGRKIISISALVKQVKLVKDMIEHRNIRRVAEGKRAIEVATVFGKMKSKYRDADIILGSLKKAGTGFDEVGKCENWNGKRINTLILLNSLASIGIIVQTFGRAFRSTDPRVYYMIDSLGVIDKHLKTASIYAKKAKGTVKEFDVETILPSERDIDEFRNFFDAFEDESEISKLNRRDTILDDDEYPLENGDYAVYAESGESESTGAPVPSVGKIEWIRPER
jgi:superfamily II DNA or RNA helicase